MDWSVFFDFLGAGGGLMVLLKWLSDLPFVRLRLKGEREDAFREMLEKDSRLIDELHGEVLQLKERFYAQEACLENWCSALCTTVALLAGSCRSINESTTIHRLDSLVWDRKVSATPEIIPPARAALSVPLDSLRKLPGGAAYTERSGQATVSLTFREGDVIASARCDSLERLVFELAEQLYSRGEQTEQRKKRKRLPSPPSANGSMVFERCFNRIYFNGNHSIHL